MRSDLVSLVQRRVLGYIIGRLVLEVKYIGSLFLYKLVDSPAHG